MAGTTRDEITLWLGLSRYFVDVSYPLTQLFPAKLRIKDVAQYAFWVDMRSRGWKLDAVDEPFAAMSLAGYDELYAYRYDWDEQDYGKSAQDYGRWGLGGQAAGKRGYGDYGRGYDDYGSKQGYGGQGGGYRDDYDHGYGAGYDQGAKGWNGQASQYANKDHARQF